MEQKDARRIQQELAKPFAPEDLEWRLQQTEENGKWGLAIPYVGSAPQPRQDKQQKHKAKQSESGPQG